MTEKMIEDVIPKFTGRGTWVAIHTLTANALNTEQRRSAIWVIKTLVANIKCNVCLEHGSKYIKDHPLDDLEYNAEKLFKWTYDFHDSVNKRLGRVSPSYDTVRYFYFESNERCSKECADDGIVPDNYIE